MDPKPTKCSTRWIGRRQAERLFCAVRFAGDKGRPMNTHITLSFTDLGLDEAAASDFFIWLRTSFRRRWKREFMQNGRALGTFDDMHAHENPNGGRRHVHWLMHRPSQLPRAELEQAISQRIKRRAGIENLGSALHIQHDDVVLAPGTLAKYILKGTDPAFGGYFYMRTAPMGWVTGRRTGTSRTLGVTARATAGWSRKGQEKAKRTSTLGENGDERFPRRPAEAP